MIEFTLFFIIAYAASIFATVAGFGSSTLIMPFAVMFLDFPIALFLVATFHLFNNLIKLRFFSKSIDYKLFLAFGLTSILFAWIGSTIVLKVPEEILIKSMAVFILLHSIFALSKKNVIIKPTTSNSLIGGATSGFLAGIVGLGGAIRALYLNNYKLPKEVYIATSAFIALLIDITRISSYVYQKIPSNEPLLLILTILFIIAYLGVITGKKLLGKINQDKFQKIVIYSLIFVSILLIFGYKVKS